MYFQLLAYHLRELILLLEYVGYIVVVNDTAVSNIHCLNLGRRTHKPYKKKFNHNLALISALTKT
jgi:hypothetical protein